MADVTLIMRADNSDHIRKIKEVQQAHQNLNKTVVANQQREKGLIEDIEDALTDLQTAKKKAYSVEEITKYNQKIAEAKKDLEEYNNAGLKVEKTQQSMITSLAKWSAGFATVTAALALLKSAINSTGKTADEFSFIIEGLKQGFEAVKRTIATLDFKNFVSNVKSAIDEGRRYAESLDAIDDKTRALRISESKLRNEIIALRIVQNAANVSQKERNIAGAKAIEIEEKLATIRTQIADQAAKNELANIVSITKATEEQVLAYVTQDEEFMKGLEIGKKYNELLKERDNLQTGTIGPGLVKLNEQIANATDEQRKWGEIVNKIVIPTDEKYELLTRRIIELEEAKGSAMEGTLRIRTMLSAGIKKENADISKDLDKATKDFDEFVQGVREAYLAPIPADFRDNIKSSTKEIAEEVGFIITDAEASAIEERLDVLRKDRAKKAKDDEDAILDSKRQSWDTIIAGEQAVFDILAINSDNNLNREIQALDKKTQAELRAAGDNEKKKQAILDKSEAEKLNIEKKYRKEQQKIAVAQTLINGAQAIIKTFAEYGYTPPGWVAAGLMAALTALQVGVIKAQKFAKGGWTGKGGQRDETGERIAGIVHEEEFVTKRGPAAKYREVLEAINRDDRRAMINSFNKIDIPDIMSPQVNNSIMVDNRGPNSRLDKVIKEQQRLNEQISRQSQIVHRAGKTVITRGNKVRITG
jgi:hypothetical protein